VAPPDQASQLSKRSGIPVLLLAPQGQPTSYGSFPPLAGSPP
jgi:hypothetical protein